jgi:hypothetical protein
MSFTLNITLGNDGMNTPQDVARALQEVIRRLKGNDPEEGHDSGRLYDINGNSVGKWEYHNASVIIAMARGRQNKV